MRLRITHHDNCTMEGDKGADIRTCNCPLIWSGLLNIGNYNPLGTLMGTTFVSHLDDKNSPCCNIHRPYACPMKKFLPEVKNG